MSLFIYLFHHLVLEFEVSGQLCWERLKSGSRRWYTLSCLLPTTVEIVRSFPADFQVMHFGLALLEGLIGYCQDG